MFSYDELLGLFSEEYPEETIKQAIALVINQLGLPEDTKEFSATITEDLEKALKIVGDVASNKALAGSTQPIEQSIVAQATQQLVDSGVNSGLANPTFVAALVNIGVQQGVISAANLLQVQERAFQKTFEEGQARLIQKAAGSLNKFANEIGAIANDPNKIDLMLENMGAPTSQTVQLSTQALREELARGKEKVKLSTQALRDELNKNKQTWEGDYFLL